MREEIGVEANGRQRRDKERRNGSDASSTAEQILPEDPHETIGEINELTTPSRS